MTTQIDTFSEDLNPLDSVEAVLSANNWEFSRVNSDELMVQVAGKACTYRLFFIWQEDISAMQFCIQYDLTVLADQHMDTREAMMNINETLIMGHFDLPRDTGTPTFRHTSLFRGSSYDAGLERLEDLIDISLTLCEKYFPIFSLLCGTAPMDEKSMSLALMETVGES